MIRTTLTAAAFCALMVSGQASAALLVDRGLPTANLNNAAGADRSNVSWSFTQYAPSDYFMVGDTFTNNTSANWQIDSIRLWTTGETDTAVLRGGIVGGVFGDTTGVISGSPILYSDSSTYQGSSGAPNNMYQVDFAVNIVLGAGQVFNFFLDGSGSANAGLGTSIPFVHASNAARSGSAQDGADDQMLYVQVLNGVVDYQNFGTWSSSDPGMGWDKASDVNVQVFGNAVPEPGSLALLGLAMGGLAFARKRKTTK